MHHSDAANIFRPFVMVNILSHQNKGMIATKNSGTRQGVSLVDTHPGGTPPPEQNINPVHSFPQ
jgi:hypothetical protein